MSIELARWQQELLELRGISQGLSAQLLAAADDLRDQGSGIPNDLLTQLSRYGMRLQTLQASLRLAYPQLPGNPSLDDLEVLLQSQQHVQQALQVLDSASRLKHREQLAFAPLNRVLELCQSLREQLATPGASGETAEDLVEGRHAVAALVQLVREPDSLTDERWQSLQELVARQFGRELATAVARGRVTESLA
ncbi:hypothetical protein GC163_10400 [bacterium]|nr:hypothetical protein [bacterium]